MLGGCSNALQDLNVQTVVRDVPQPKLITLPKPKPIDLSDVKWVIVRDNGGNLIALSPKEYEKLANNIAEIIRYVREADSQLEYYRDVR